MLGKPFTIELHPIHTAAFEKCLEGASQMDLNFSPLPSDSQTIIELADKENKETIFLNQKVKSHYVIRDKILNMWQRRAALDFFFLLSF